MTLTEKLTALADAVREKTGRTEPMTLDEMTAEIDGLSVGGEDAFVSQLTVDGTDFSYIFLNGRDRYAETEVLTLPPTANGKKFISTYENCRAKQLPQTIDISGAEVVDYMFRYLGAAPADFGFDLSGLVLDMQNVTSAKGMFFNSYIGYFPQFLHMEKVETVESFAQNINYGREIYLTTTCNCKNFRFAFGYGCAARKITVNIDSATDCTGMIGGVYKNLTDLVLIGKLKTSLTIAANPNLTRESLQSVIDALFDFSGTDSAFVNTITFSDTAWETLDGEGNAAPNGMTWREYITSIGWNT